MLCAMGVYVCACMCVSVFTNLPYRVGKGDVIMISY